MSTPSETARARLRQMRESARSFKVEFTNRKGEKEQLRLLTQPSYRYKSTDPTVLDGALFVFAQGSNPETVLLIEARQTNNGYRWQFAFARQTGHELNAFYKDRRVWNVPPAIGEDKLKRTAPYTVFYRYPQADTAS